MFIAGLALRFALASPPGAGEGSTSESEAESSSRPGRSSSEASPPEVLSAATERAQAREPSWVLSGHAVTSPRP